MISNVIAKCSYKCFSHIEPAPPLMSEESRDYLNQVPPNLYTDNSYTGNDTASTAGLSIAVAPSPSVNIAAPTGREGSNADSSRNEAVTPAFGSGINNNSFARESVSPEADRNIIFQHENQGNGEAEAAFGKEPISCESSEIEHKQHPDFSADTPSPSQKYPDSSADTPSHSQKHPDSSADTLSPSQQHPDSSADTPSLSQKEEETEPPYNNDEKKQLTIDSNGPLFQHVEHEDTEIPATMSEGLESVLPFGEESKNIENVQGKDESYNSVGLSLSSLKSHENSTLTPIG